MKKIDYGFKSFCLSQTYANKPLVEMLRKIESGLNVENEFSILKKKCFELYEDIENTFDDSILMECKKINKAYYNRLQRLKERVKDIVNSDMAIFLTLTFNDAVLNSTTSETRRQYIKKFLVSLKCKYIANVDFGKKNGREHYHALIEKDKVDGKTYTYGAINFQRVRRTKDTEKITKYIAKLTNHAVKETTKRSVIMYSRNF